MSDLPQLYQQVILDHGRNPRGTRVPEACNRSAKGHNPLCGDQVDVKLRQEGDVVAEIGFKGAGCAIATAAASLMTEAVRGKTVSEIRELSHRFRQLATGQIDPSRATDLGKLAVFAGVSGFPMRVKCATLAWHTLEAALDSVGTASTE